jgi:hypothetical protein
VSTLRVPALYNDYYGALLEGFVALYELYTESAFGVSITANVILQGGKDKTFSIFYGQDFSKLSEDDTYAAAAAAATRTRRDFSIAAAVKVSDLSDVSKIRTDFTRADFSSVFFTYFENSDVRVHGISNIVYIMTQDLDNVSARGKLSKKNVFMVIY